MTGASSPHGEDEQLRQDGARIEQLLDEIHGMAGPHTWERVEELVQRLVGLYGAGLARLLAHARDTGAAEASLATRLCGDELVSSLLVLHGLHPVPVAARVQQALDAVRPYFDSHAGDVELLGVDDTVVQLRLLGTCRGCPSSRATSETLLRRVIEEAAPEVTRIDIDGVRAGEAEAGALVQLEVRRTRETKSPTWVALEGLEAVGREGRQLLDVAGMRVLVLQVGVGVVAFRDACAGCGASLEHAPLEGALLACPDCSLRYDVGRAGRAVLEEGPSLVPLPLLVEGTRARLAVPEAGS
jgi:Fe-S cluster biogenesis protein NfuA